MPTAAAGPLPGIHFAVATLGLWCMIPGIYLAISQHAMALAIIGSLLTLLSMLLFLAIVLMNRPGATRR